jgi:MscS family membrane protein
MKRFLLSHLGTILIALLLAVVVWIALNDPEKTKSVLSTAWSNTISSPAADPDAPKAAAVLQTIEWRRLLSDNSPGQWFVVLAAIFLGFLAGKIAATIVGRAGRALDERGLRARAHIMASLVGPISLALFTFGLSVGVFVLTLEDALAAFLTQILNLLYTASIVWYIYNLVDLLDITFQRLRGRIESRLDAQLIPLLRRSLRVVLVLVAFLYVARNVFDQDVSAWLTGLGIAGLAVSLAAQDSLKSLFGSFVILLDRPFKVGERIIYDRYDGVIEDIGFRSTKLRTGAGNLVTIPNANIASHPIENVSRRPFIQRVFNVTIACDTPREKIVEAIATLKGILAENGIREPIHPTVAGEYQPPRVYFSDYNASSLNIQVSYWYAPPAYWDYMAHAERLNLRILEEFERLGIEIAFPTQTLYLAGDPRRKLVLETSGSERKP